MTTTASSRLSLAAFLRIPEQEPALELNPDGSISQKMSPNTEHAAIAAHLARLLLNHIDASGSGGYVYVELRINVGAASRLPDVALYRRRPPQTKRKHALAVADLAIEIQSPGQDDEQQRAKCRWYVEQGATTALLLDPETRTIEVIPPGERYAGGRVLPLAVVPGLELTPADIFAVLDR